MEASVNDPVLEVTIGRQQQQRQLRTDMGVTTEPRSEGSVRSSPEESSLSDSMTQTAVYPVKPQRKMKTPRLPRILRATETYNRDPKDINCHVTVIIIYLSSAQYWDIWRVLGYIKWRDINYYVKLVSSAQYWATLHLIYTHTSYLYTI